MAIDIKKARQLAQSAPTDTNAASFYSPPTGIRGSVRIIIVNNYSGSNVEYSIYHDSDGNTASNATALYSNKVLENGVPDKLEFEEPGIIVDSSGTVSVEANTANAVTFTAYGEEVTK